MIKKILGRWLLLLLAMVSLVGTVSLPVYATKDALDQEIKTTPQKNICDKDQNNIPVALKRAAGCESDETLPGVSITIVRAILGLLGVLAVGIMVFGAVTYSTSAGDPGKAHKGQMTLLYGLVGLLICFMAFAIITFVSDGVFG